MDYLILIFVLVAVICVMVCMLVDIYRSHVEVAKTHKDIVEILVKMEQRQEKKDVRHDN